MQNRFCKWMDTNTIWPRGPNECIANIDWFAEEELVANRALINNSNTDSEQVRIEDIELCERVQKGLNSSAYDVGRYSNFYEGGEYWFAQRIQMDLEKAIEKNQKKL